MVEKMQAFIEAKKTIKNDDRDFVEWHKGREYYALWAVQIAEPAWIKNVEKTKQYLNNYFLADNMRKPHITICTSGFVERTRAYEDKLEEQIKLIKNSDLRLFTISLGALNSFAMCPYFRVEDPINNFSRIREILLGTVLEERTKKYIPHITVGLYNDSYSTMELAEKIESFDKIQTSSIEVKNLSYFIYKTNSIFSPLEEQFQITLPEYTT